MPATRRYRWFVVGVFFCFMLLHQTDRLLIGLLTTPIIKITYHAAAGESGQFSGKCLI